MEQMERFGYLFYIVSPTRSLFQDPTHVPAYVNEAIPYFVAILFIEQVIAFYKGIQNFKINDAITSAGQGILMEQTKWVISDDHNHWRNMCLNPWNSDLNFYSSPGYCFQRSASYSTQLSTKNTESLICPLTAGRGS